MFSYVVTAAHCVSDEIPDSIAVRIGQYSLQEPTPNLKISKITIHEKYNSVSQKDDIALLRLSQPIQYTDNIEPVCLPPSDLSDPDNLKVVGWGRTSEGGRPSSTLNEISLPQYSFAKCEDKYSGLLTINQLCAGGVSGHDTCQVSRLRARVSQIELTFVLICVSREIREDPSPLLSMVGLISWVLSRGVLVCILNY
jgi:secreted trypsin-like serine protease